MSNRGVRSYLLVIAGAAALGGLLFGYDTAVISGAVGFLQSHFNLSAGLTGWAASSALVGCMAGSMAGGPLGDRCGRKPMLLACAGLFAISGVASALPNSIEGFVWARFAGGFAIGAVSVLSPLYIAEIAPEAMRGRLVALYQLAIVAGILAVFFINLLIQRCGDETWNTACGWRWMLGSLTIPSLLFFVLLLPVPESPRWLMRVGRKDEARMVLNRLGDPEAALREEDEISRSLKEECGGLTELLGSRYRRPLVIGIVLAIICQFSGINAIMYYAPEIFKNSDGGGRDSAFLQTVIIGVVNLFFTFVAIACVDRFGRRPLLLVGSAVQVVSLTATGLALHLGLGGFWLLVPILFFIAAFASAMGPVPWIVISEIFPTHIRGKAMSLATLALWTACFTVSQTFPLLQQAWGPAVTFWIYSGCSLIGLIFVYFIVPETRGRTLEDIAAGWK